MNRARKSNRGLPRRVYVKHGAYRFFAPAPIIDPSDRKEKRWIHLAYVHEGEQKMLTALAKLLADTKNDAGSMPYVCEQYKLHKLNRFSEETKKMYRSYLDEIADAFEKFQVVEVTTKDFADFLWDRWGSDGKHNTARKVTALGRNLFSFAISKFGLRKDNPLDHLDMSDFEMKRREVLPTHDQIAKIRQHGLHSKERKDTGKRLPNPSGEMFACIIDMAYLCWARAVDIRTLKESQIDGGWIRLKPGKTAKTSGKAVDIMITPAIQAVIDRAREIKKGYKVISPYLFCKTKGGAYTKNGLNQMWVRARERAKITEDIQFKDLRALGATDAAKAGEEKEAIRKRLVHTTSKTSEIYIKDVIPETSEIDMKLPWQTV